MTPPIHSPRTAYRYWLLAIVLFILATCYGRPGYGQKVVGLPGGDTIVFDTVIIPTNPYLDTTAVIILYCDTASRDKGVCLWANAYEVRKIYPQQIRFPTLIGYLDSARMPLPPSIVIWICRKKPYQYATEFIITN